MRHRCDSCIIYYLTLMTLKTPEMTGTKLKIRSKFRFRLDSVPATGRNFSEILDRQQALCRVNQAVSSRPMELS
jgi:hypothetical protein